MLLFRRSIALFAAYVVALQLFLLPLGVAAASVVSGEHCTASEPAQYQTQGCPCAAGCGTGCCAQTLIGPPPAVSGLAPELTHPDALPIAASRAVRPAFAVAHQARGPPAAAYI
jgi:hypothetical protein